MASQRGMSVLLASNRGPVSFVREKGALRSRSGGGGLAAALSSVPNQAGLLWVCSALSDTDRAVARGAPRGRLDLAGYDTGGVSVRLLDIDPETLARAYNGVANSVLWFVHHMLYDTPTEPVFDGGFVADWASYLDYNAAFATALAEEAAPGARVLVQDYHLSLVPRLLRELRPDLAIAHFSHTPWAPPDYFQLLPADTGVALLTGLLAADHVGFLAPRWARAFLDCCEVVLGARVDRDNAVVEHDGRAVRVAVHPLGVDAESFRARVNQPDVAKAADVLRDLVGDRRLVARVDRAELSKNIVRGLLAYQDLLRRYPRWRGQVVHLALTYPSRQDLPQYREYTATMRRVADQIIDEFATPDWTPLVLAVEDDYPRSLAAYRLADVALVNPIRDGMNLVAKEFAVASDKGCALVLSREAGVAAEFSDAALLVNPFDVTGTADALHAALSMDDDERRERCARLAIAAGAYPPGRWLTDQVAALDRVRDTARR
ncbi:alpha,alpha-trehalose-phosphate synthase (UDP-forming) [Thermasporomyces composti]|nr:trehalose-6-phosphate synthase [Thermasporomyces composti]